MLVFTWRVVWLTWTSLWKPSQIFEIMFIHAHGVTQTLLGCISTMQIFKSYSRVWYCNNLNSVLSAMLSFKCCYINTCLWHVLTILLKRFLNLMIEWWGHIEFLPWGVLLPLQPLALDDAPHHQSSWEGKDCDICSIKSSLKVRASLVSCQC